MLDVETMVSGIHWPAIPTPRASQLLALQFQLEQSQWLTAAQLAERQFDQLGRVVAHARRTVPFYSDRLECTGLGTSQAIDRTRWHQLPPLTRAEIQSAGDRLHSTNGADEHGPRSVSVTSGATGKPVATLGTTVTRMMWSAITLRQHIWHRRDLSRKFAAIRWREQTTDDSGGIAHADSWGTATAGVVRTGPAVALDIHASIEEQAAWLVAEEPDYLLTYPSNALALARHFIAKDLELRNLREVRTFGEALDPQVRPTCLQAWGVPVVDNYSAQEVGYIALQCPTCQNYHVQAENVLVEVLDDAGGPCQTSQVGRMVVSTLQNFAMPLLRYEIGDYAEVGEPCDCGRGLPVLRRILGRKRNIFRLPSGRQIWPSFSFDDGAVQSALARIRQFQVVQRTSDQLDVKLVTHERLGGSVEGDLTRWLQKSLGYPFSVRFTYVQSIPRSAGGKFEDFRSEVA